MARILKLRRVPGTTFERSPAGPLGLEGNLTGLIERCRSGDSIALRTLLTSLAPSMLQVIRRVLGMRHPEVEDALQEAMLAATRALPTFRGECGIRHFACRIATFVAISARRRQALPADESSSNTAFEDEVFPAGAETDWALSARRRELVRALLDQLPIVQAEALVLHCVEGWTVEELAIATEVPAETARSRLRLAKAALRLRIADDAAASELVEDFS